MSNRRAFSYLRFSTPEQQRGDSFRRQKDLAERYAAAEGLELDERSFEDLGVSAFRGRNASSGMLGTFLELVETGSIPKGTYLLVESLDRLSRATARKALRQLEEMCELGIVIITLTDGKRYDLETLDRDPMALMYALVLMMRAHEESAMKSGRLKAAWKAKRGRARERPLTARVPAWLRLAPNKGAFEVIESRAAVVRRIFELALEGMGQHAIASTLNREAVPTFGRGRYWQRSYVKKILGNAAVMGAFVPHTVEYEGGKRQRRPVEVVEGYFPVVVSPETFDRAQKLRLGSKATRSHSALRNLFAGLAECPKCHSTMTRITKGRKGGKPYLVCVAAKQGAGCHYHAVHQDRVEEAFLANVSDLTREVPSARTVLANEIKVTENVAAALRVEIDQIVGEIRKQGPSAHISARLASRQQMLRDLEKERLETAARFNAAHGPALVPRMRELLSECRKPSLDRCRINALLRQLFGSVVIEYDMDMLAFQWRHGGETAMLMPGT